MAIENFGWCPARDSGAGDVVPLTRESRMGEGYTVTMSEGINPWKQTHPVTIRGSKAMVKEVMDFLDRHGGYKAFTFTPPLGRQGYYYAPNGYKPLPLGGDNAQVSMVLVQTFKA